MAATTQVRLLVWTLLVLRGVCVCAISLLANRTFPFRTVFSCAPPGLVSDFAIQKFVG